MNVNRQTWTTVIVTQNALTWKVVMSAVVRNHIETNHQPDSRDVFAGWTNALMWRIILAIRLMRTARISMMATHVIAKRGSMIIHRTHKNLEGFASVSIPFLRVLIQHLTFLEQVGDVGYGSVDSFASSRTWVTLTDSLYWRELCGYEIHWGMVGGHNHVRQLLLVIFGLLCNVFFF